MATPYTYFSMVNNKISKDAKYTASTDENRFTGLSLGSCVIVNTNTTYAGQIATMFDKYATSVGTVYNNYYYKYGKIHSDVV